MKHQTLAVIGLTTVTGLTMSAWAADPTLPAMGAGTVPFVALPYGSGDAISAIAQATTPPEAVAAFARGLALHHGNAKLYQAYVQKLVEFDLPDLAVSPAQTLVALQPDNALALAVLGLDAARRGDIRVATTDIVIAAARAPDDVFVQHGSGQVLAWYDRSMDHSMIPASVVSSLEMVRAQLQGKQVYADAYRLAMQTYQDRAAAARAAAQNQQAAPAMPKPDPPGMHELTTASPVVNNYYTYGPTACVPPAVVTSPAPSYVYPSAYYAAPAAYPCWSCPFPFPFLSFAFRFGHR